MTSDELARSYFSRAAKRMLALRVLIEHRPKFPPALQSELDTLAEISLRLRRDREAAFYGDIDLIPERVFDRDSAERAMSGAQRVMAAVRLFETP
jgi:hypothetical protein